MVHNPKGMGPTPTVAARKGKGIHVTREQKSILKDAFKFIPYPDHYPDSLAKLSADTGLDQEAIKKWFRNRRKKIGNKSATTENDEEINDIEDVNEGGNVSTESVGETSQQEELPSKDSVENEERDTVKSCDNYFESSEEERNAALGANEIDASALEERVATSDVNETDEPTSEDVKEKEKIIEQSTADSDSNNLDNMQNSPKMSEGKHENENDVENSGIDIPQDERSCTVSDILVQDKGKTSSKDDVPSNEEEAKLETIRNEDLTETGSKGKVTEEMSTEQKAANYDVLKQEFLNLQNRFEGLAKILGSHGIDVGENNLPNAQPSTSQQPSPETPTPEAPSYYPPPVQAPNMHPGEQFVPKQEPQSYSWDYNHQTYNQPWQQYPPYPPTQMYPTPTNYSYPFAPQPYNLPYPPPDPQFHLPQPINQAVCATAQGQDIPPPQSAGQVTMNRPVAAPDSKEVAATDPVGLVDPVDGSTNQNFKGDIAAPKKSFQGPSNKLKRKSLPPTNRAKAAQPAPQVMQTPAQIPAKRPRAQTSQVFPTSIDLAGQSVNAPPHQRRKSLPMKTKLGAFPKPSPKKVPLLEQSLQANNPFRSNKKSVNVLKRQPPPVSPEIQTLFPPIQNLRGMQPKKQRTPDIEYVSTERRNPLPGPRLPNLGSGISIQKVYNPLNDPNKPQELKKVLAMSNLSVSLASRK